MSVRIPIGMTALLFALAAVVHGGEAAVARPFGVV